ncbi:disease resistance protein RML1A [Pyrus x bretschneideri]|uniref:disease resistance protein RML1A n=1 Tax=Pyrus x bretschneideri TaxID=225117 RepID=UPI00202F520F|nr:disease resistance protein RML1A [Pyrus x bretschneideri]
MEFTGIFQVFFIIVITIMTLFYMCRCGLLKFSCWTASYAASNDAANDDAHEEDDDIPPHQEKYDVFISFRGEDTRLTFTSHLHDALLQKKIETYIDYRLVRGDEIWPALLEAIQKSTLSVIILSKSYASSTWCLDELVHILKCKEKYGQMVIPIFYDINPSEVRKQQGSYAYAFAQLEKRFKGNDKVHKWRAALATTANLSGFDNTTKKGTEADLVKHVVEDIWTKLTRESSCDLKGLVGIEGRIEQIESLLCLDSPDACNTVGIWGMGGIGKTTLVEAVFHRLSWKFEACCFLRNVREREQRDGLVQLRNTVVREVFKEKDLNIETSTIGSALVRKRLGRTKVLIVLDDVNDSCQLDQLLGDGIGSGPGSRIIITTRDRALLEEIVVDDKNIYEVRGLERDDALQLFRLNAFKNNTPITDYTRLSSMVVSYAGGIPLALKIMGSSFHGKSREEWEEELNKLKQFPNEKIQDVLRLSYDGLGRNEKEIFLDIACFHKGKHVDEVKRMVDIRGLFATSGIRVLIKKSLISIVSTRKTLEMHDLVQEMGRAIVLEQCIEEPGKRSRLFIAEDVYHVLKNRTGTSTVQAIFFNRSNIEELDLDGANFKQMSKLIFLGVYKSSTYRFEIYGKLNFSLDLPNSLRYIFWHAYPLESLPSKFSAINLVELHMPESQVEKLWDEDKVLMNLKVFNMRSSRNLTELPNLSQSRKLEHINLVYCTSLVEVPSYFQHLHELTFLELAWCTSLKYLPKMPGNIEYLSLRGSGIKELPPSVWSHQKISSLDIGDCRDLKKLPNNNCKLKVSGYFSLEYCSSLDEFSELPRDISVLDLTCTSIEVLPISSMECLISLTTIKLNDCERLVTLPPSICKLKSLKELDLTGCSKFKNFPEIFEPMEHLEFLSLEGTAVKELHSSIEFLFVLKKIQLTGCKMLTSLPTRICKLKSLERLDLTGCSAFFKFPEIMEPMEHLEFLRLAGTRVKELPSSIENLIGLQTLDLRLCSNFEVYPSSINSLTNLKTLSFRHCLRLKKVPPFSVGLLSLEKLDLCYSGLLKIPSGLIHLASLRDLELSGTMINSIPASIKQASELRSLRLNNCKRLQSLPELPVLQILEADGCISLKTVSSSRTALVQGWDKYELFQGVLKFYNCRALDWTARSNIMADAQLRIMRVATTSSNVRGGEDNERDSYPRPLVTIVYQGKEIPSWFSYQNEGSSIKLPQDWFRKGFLGFAFSVVIAYDFYPLMWVEVNFKFKTNNGESHNISCPNFYSPHKDGGWYDYNFSRYHVHVWYNAFELAVEGVKCSADFYKHVSEASVYFIPVGTSDDLEVKDDGELMSPKPMIKRRRKVSKSMKVKMPKYVEVERCGICPLYAEDDEKLRLDVMLREAQVEEGARQDDSEANGSSDEPEASGSYEPEESSDESETSSSGESGGRDKYEAYGSDESEEIIEM